MRFTHVPARAMGRGMTLVAYKKKKKGSSP